jgi:uncharacterized protein (DUF488 family)
MPATVFTIGFTRKSARDFFGALTSAKVRRVVDVRLGVASQLAGFAKKDDLKYFLRDICGIGYIHLPELAPTRDILDEYRKRKDRKPAERWKIYEDKFLNLMARRNIERLPRADICGGCLLCSEDKPHFCHRRLVAEYLRREWGDDLEIRHLPETANT